MNLWRYGIALGVGILGGAAFARLSMPMPWMLGPLFSCLAASLFKVPMASPIALRPPLTATLGIMMGAAYTPELLSRIGDWWATIAGLLVFMFVSGAVSVAYFRYIVRCDLATAYFAGMPGGFIEMVLLGEQSGADLRRVALVHAARIILTIFAVPFIVLWLDGHAVVSGRPAGVSIEDMRLEEFGWLAFCLVFGMLAGMVLRVPARYLVGPLLVSITVHMTGLSAFKVPWQFILVAQLVIGVTVGCRFVGIKLREVLLAILMSLGSSVLMIGISVIVALTVSRMTEHSLVELLLAYSPGGLVEMGLLSVALGLDVAVVSTHHILRICLAVVFASVLMRFLGLRRTQ